MKRKMGVLLGLVALVPAVSFATGPTAEEVLERVSQTYCGLSSFRFIEQQESQPAGSMSGMIGPNDLPAPFGGRAARCETDLAVSTPGKIRLVVSSEQAKIQLVSDGRKTWAYIPDLNEYLEADAAPLLQELWANPLDLISDDLARYRSLSHEAGPAKLRGEESLSLAGRKTRCYVVEVPSIVVLQRYASGAMGAMAVVDLPSRSGWRRLWVDEQRFIVLRDEWTSGAGAGPDLPDQRDAFFWQADFVRSRLTGADLRPMPDDLFQFDAPSGTRRVDSFSAPAWPVQVAEAGLEARLIGGPQNEDHLLRNWRAPNFTAGSPGGENVRLDRLHGKIVVLDFWASWCQPCQEQLAVVQKLHDELASKGVVFLGIDDESSQTVNDFVKAHGYTFPTLLDPKLTVDGLYGVRLVPTTVVIDRKGKIAAHYVGAGGEAQLRTALKAAGLKTTKP